ARPILVAVPSRPARGGLDQRVHRPDKQTPEHDHPDPHQADMPERPVAAIPEHHLDHPSRLAVRLAVLTGSAPHRARGQGHESRPEVTNIPRRTDRWPCPPRACTAEPCGIGTTRAVRRQDQRRAVMAQQTAASGRCAPAWPKDALRIGFGVIWLIDALLKWL